MATRDASRRVVPRAAASAVILRGECVLLVERGKGGSKGLWSLPGGRIEPGERAIEAARREVFEETGIHCAIDGLLDVHDVVLRTSEGEVSAHYLIAVFCGRWASGEPAAGDDSRTAMFVPITALGEFNLTEGAALLIRRAADRAAAFGMR